MLCTLYVQLGTAAVLRWDSPGQALEHDSQTVKSMCHEYTVFPTRAISYCLFNYFNQEEVLHLWTDKMLISISNTKIPLPISNWKIVGLPVP